MAFITVTCPNCGGQSQIEAGRSIVCPYCAYMLDPKTDAAPDMQFAQQPMQPDMQFAQQPAPMQDMQFMQQNAPMPMQNMQPGQFMPQNPQFQPYQQISPAQLADAQKKRKSWYVQNWAMLGIQALVMALGLLFVDLDNRLGVPMILCWLLSLPACAILSGMMRPDEAYIEKKPLFKSKITQGFVQFLLSAASTSAVGGILFAILEGFFGLL